MRPYLNWMNCMHLPDVRIFAMVASGKSLSAAARRLGITPMQVSRRIAALEEELSTRLLHRTTRSVSLTAEGEAFLAKKEQGGENFEIVVPSLSILAEPPVAVVDKTVDKKGTRKVAEEYLKYLYSEEGQRIAAQNFYRPRNAKVAAEFANQFPKLDLVTIDKDFGGWKVAQPKFFNDGGIFDKIYAPGGTATR